MALDISQVAGSAPFYATAQEKLDALALLFTQLLALHTTTGTWKPVATFADPRLRLTLGRQDQIDVMGEPARYVEVVWVGKTYQDDPTWPYHIFEVGVYFGTGTDRSSGSFAADLASSHAAFLDLCEAESDSVPGILRALTRQEEIACGAHTCALGQPDGINPGTIPGARGREDLFALQFSITIA